MARTALTIVQLKQNNYAVQAGDLAIVPAAMDNTNGNTFVATGQEILVFQNTDAGAQTITISSVADALGRTGDIATYSLAAGAFAAIQMKQIAGWLQSGGIVNLTASAATMKVAVLRYV